MGKEVEVLEHHADFSADLVDLLDIAGELDVVDDDLALLVFLQAMGPQITILSPFCTVRLMSFSTWKSPYHLCIPTILMATSSEICIPPLPWPLPVCSTDVSDIACTP
jgi:hypothetical protein